MEKRNIFITLEKAKEWYQQGGDLKEVALQAYTESELVTWPTDFNDSRLDLGASRANVPTKIWYQWKLYKLLEILNPKDFNPGYNIFYLPRIWWYRNIKNASIYSNEKYVGEVKTLKDETLYITIGGASVNGFLAGLFASSSSTVFSGSAAYFGAINQLKCATPEIQQHLEKYFWKYIIKAYYDETIFKIEEI